MGWSPVARSMTRRRWIPRPAPPSTCRPRESGPRCSSAAHMRSSTARSTGRPLLVACPTMPHTFPCRASVYGSSCVILSAHEASRCVRRLLRHALPPAPVRGAGAADGGRLLLLRRRARALLESPHPARRRRRLPAGRAAPLPRRGRGGHAGACPGAQPAPVRRGREVAERAADAAPRVPHRARPRRAVRAVDGHVVPPADGVPPGVTAADAPHLPFGGRHRRLR